MRPYLFQIPDWVPLIGERPVFSYGVLLGIAFIAGWSLCVQLCRRDGFDARTVITTLIAIVVCGLLGARILHYFSSPTAQFSFSDFFKFDEGGLVAYGGILGGIVGSTVALRLQDTDWWAFADNATPGLAIGLGITRIGCYLFGCDYGVRSTDALAVSFPRWDDMAVGPWMPASSPAHSDHVVAGLDFASAHSYLVHPTQLYESLVGFFAFTVLILWRPKKRFHGQICLAFLVYYAIARFAIELLRGDADRGDSIMLGMSTSQLIGFLMLGGLLVMWFRQAARGLYAARGTGFTAPNS